MFWIPCAIVTIGPSHGTGGDGYTAFAQGTDVLQPGDDLMQLVVEYVSANSPVAPVVNGRIAGP